MEQTPGRIARSLSALTGGFPRPKWPNPEASVGTFCGMMKKYKCWDATGRVQKLFVEISPKINELLRTTCPPVPKNGVIGYGIFMIGTTPETSVPHIMFACTLPGPRKQALQELRESDIIDTYAPGFHTGHWRNPPHIDNPEFLAKVDCDADIDGDSDSDSEDDSVESTKDLWTAEVTALDDAHSFPASCRVQFRRPRDPSAVPLSATTGGVIYISQRPFLLTVAHVLPPPEASDDQAVMDTFLDNVAYADSSTDDNTNSNTDSDPDSEPNGNTDDSTDGNVEVDADSRTDGSETDFEDTELADMSDDEFEFGGFESSSTDATDGGITTSGNSDTSDSSDSERSQSIHGDAQPTQYQASEVILNAVDGRVRELNEQKNARRVLDRLHLRPTHGEPMSLSLSVDAGNVMGSPDLDYMLVPVEPSVSVSRILGLPTIMRRDASPMPHVNTHVQTSTSSGGSVNGILWGCSSFICIKGTRSFQRVWPLSLGSPLQPGDSGSCIFDATTKAFYGHIVAGSTTSRIAYVVSAQEVFNDIAEQLSPLVQPSSNEQHLSQAPQVQLSLVDGGPGEDSGSVVFEVRAKADKYDANDDDSNDEGSKQRRLPWKTQCMGFLRLVKNNTTGEVRLQLHAEPRATLVLDQRLDSDYTYREEPCGPKSVMITVATDDGEGLETWRLITKGSARALADALEEHKMANATKDG